MGHVDDQDYHVDDHDHIDNVDYVDHVDDDKGQGNQGSGWLS